MGSKQTQFDTQSTAQSQLDPNWKVCYKSGCGWIVQILKSDIDDIDAIVFSDWKQVTRFFDEFSDCLLGNITTRLSQDDREFDVDEYGLDEQTIPN